VFFTWLYFVDRQRSDLNKFVPEVLTILVNLVRDYEKEPSFKPMLSDIFDVTTFFCQAAGLSEINKSLIQSMLALPFVQQLSMEAATESSNEKQSVLQRHDIFPEFLCLLV
jgi:hypothetical protein